MHSTCIVNHFKAKVIWYNCGRNVTSCIILGWGWAAVRLIPSLVYVATAASQWPYSDRREWEGTASNSGIDRIQNNK